MHSCRRIFVSLVLWLFFIAIASHTAGAKTSLKTINNPQGGKILYGLVDGATSPAAAMAAMLRAVHNQCGEKPQVGKIFQVRGTNSVAVFFTVVKRTQGNKPVAGLLIATQAAPNHVEAALVSDDASRFGKSMNPMLKQLLSVWRPGGAGQASASATRGRSAPPAKLRPFTTPDGSASVGVPDGWKAQGAGGSMTIVGPRGETIQLNLTRMAVDPTNPNQRQLQAGGIGGNNSGKIVYPSNVNLAKAFPDLFLQFWRLNNAKSPKIQTEQAELIPGPQGPRCVHVTGQAQIFMPFMEELNATICTTAPSPMGNYLFMLSCSTLPPQVADQQRATAGAILASFKPNQMVINQQVGAMAGPAIAAIHQIGQQATRRYNATQAANDAQHAAWSQGQEDNSRDIQGFSNYLLDQTVIQDNNMYGNGTVGHGTAWNSTADTLVKANPNRFEIVESPNYWQGVDY